MPTSVRFDATEQERADKLARLRNLSRSNYIRLLVAQDWARHGDKAEEHAAIARQMEEETTVTDYKTAYSVEQYAEEFSGSSVEELRAEWAGKTQAEIQADVDDIWPNADDNEYLAQCIYQVVSS